MAAGGAYDGPSPFRAPWWLRGPHAQTAGARLLRGRRTGVSWTREVLEAPGGAAVELDRAPGDGAAPPVLLLHGLEGGSESTYIGETARRLAAAGLRGVAMNFRPRSVPPRVPSTYHAGRTREVAFAIETLARGAPGGRIGLIGFSLGGNVLLKHLAERGEEARERVAAAAAVSVPFDLAAAADRLEGWPGRLYARYFLGSLRRAARELSERFPGHLDAAAVRRARTIRAFDQAVTAPLHGFRSAEHYYATSSCGPRLGGVRIPVLLLHARDDPLVPAGTVPWETIARNPALVDGITDAGGHVGFVDGPSPLAPRFWAEREAVRFVAAHFARGRG